jgi:uncharacterized protein (TIRG00374 family)
MPDAQPPRRIPWVRLATAAVVIAGGAWLASRLDLARVMDALRHADWRLVSLAALLNLTLNTAARVGRWAPLLGAQPREGAGPRFTELAALHLAGQAVSNLLPTRAGDALRVVQLRRRHGYPVSALVTVQIVETVVAGMTLGLLALLVLGAPETPRSLSAALALLAAAGLGGGALLVWLARRARPVATGAPRTVSRPTLAPRSATPVPGSAVARALSAATSMVTRAVDAVRHLRSPGVWLRSLGWSLVSDLTDVAMIGMVLGAVGVSLSAVSWIVAFVAINLVLVLPSTPAQIGVLEVGAVAALRALGVEEHAALAFALLYHAAHVIPPTVVGGLLLVRLDLRRAPTEALATAAPGVSRPKPTTPP